MGIARTSLYSHLILYDPEMFLDIWVGGALRRRPMDTSSTA